MSTQENIVKPVFNVCLEHSGVIARLNNNENCISKVSKKMNALIILLITNLCVVITLLLTNS